MQHLVQSLAIFSDKNELHQEDASTSIVETAILFRCAIFFIHQQHMHCHYGKEKKQKKKKRKNEKYLVTCNKLGLHATSLCMVCKPLHNPKVLNAFNLLALVLENFTI